MPIPRTVSEEPHFRPKAQMPIEQILPAGIQQVPETIEQWRRAIILAEVLGPPLALRSPEWVGPTSPPALW